MCCYHLLVRAATFQERAEDTRGGSQTKGTFRAATLAHGPANGMSSL